MAVIGKETVFYRAFQFTVEIDQIQQARFQEVGGIDSTTDVIDYREGGDPLGPHRLAGQKKHSNLTLKRGYTENKELWKWYETVMTGKLDKARRHISVVQHDMDGTEKMRWNLYDAFPVKYTAPAFNAKGNDLSIEALEIAYERLEMA
jgi:phage tail-like protein